SLRIAPAGEADRGGQVPVRRKLVHDALREVVARVFEHGTPGAGLAAELGEDELRRRTAAGLGDVDQPAVPLEDAQVLEGPQPVARDGARHAKHCAAQRWTPALL